MNTQLPIGAEEKKMTENKPVKKCRFGNVTVSAWLNKSKEEKEYHTFSFQRSYKDKDDKWQNTTVLRVQDVMPLILCLTRVLEKVGMKEGDQ